MGKRRMRSATAIAGVVLAAALMMWAWVVAAGAVGPDLAGEVFDAATSDPVPQCAVLLEYYHEVDEDWYEIASDVADGDGRYSFSGLTPDTRYRIVVFGGGFAVYASAGQLYTGDPLTIDAELDAWPQAGHPVTTGPSWVVRPRLSGDRVVWAEDRDEGYDIYGFDFTSLEETRVTSVAEDQEAPDISGDWVVWIDNRNFRSSKGDVYAKNLATGEERAVRVDSSQQQHPKISGDWVVWEDFRNGSSGEVYAYNLDTSGEYLVASGRFPDVHGSRVGYWDGGQAYYKDLADLGEPAVHMGEMYEHVSMTSAYAVYDLILDDGSRGLVAYHFASGSESVLPVGDVYYDGGGFEVDGTTVVYFGKGSYDGFAVYRYNLLTDVTTVVADGWWDESWPTVSGTGVVWCDSRWDKSFGYGTDLYTNRSTSPDTVAPTTTHAVEPASPNGGGGWYLYRAPAETPKRPPLITLTADEAGITYYHWGSEPAADYADGIEMPAGTNTLTYWSEDARGNEETPRKTAVFKYDPTSPTTPGGVTAVALSTTKVRVSWTASTDADSGVAIYHVWRAAPAGYVKVAEVAGSTTSVDLTGLAPDTTHTFDVLARDVAGWNSDAARVSVKTLAPAAPKLDPVFRLYNKRSGSHFYTPSAAERDEAVRKYPTIYTYEGIAYSMNTAANTQPLYRFYNKRNGSHFLTASAAERDDIIRRYPAIYTYEGESYKVSPVKLAGSLTVYRFYNKTNGTHFFTASEAEKNDVIAKYPHVYTLEGPAYYIAQ